MKRLYVKDAPLRLFGKTFQLRAEAWVDAKEIDGKLYVPVTMVRVSVNGKDRPLHQIDRAILVEITRNITRDVAMEEGWSGDECHLVKGTR